MADDLDAWMTRARDTGDQDAFARGWAKREQYRPGTSPRAWLLTIARSLLMTSTAGIAIAATSRGWCAKSCTATWQTLDTITDLRAERSTLLQDTVQARITGSNGGGATGRCLRRLGLRRGGLEPIDPAVGRCPTSARVAVVDTVQGRVTSGQLVLGPQAAVAAEPVMLAADSELTLRWPHGTTAPFSGPATVVPQSRGAAQGGPWGGLRRRQPIGVGGPYRLRSGSHPRCRIQDHWS